MKGQLTRDEDGDLWVYIAPHHTGYWKFVDADDNWVDRGMALQVTGDAASLFEAAPEMLAALKRVVALANCAMDYSGVDAEHTLKRAMERISKAKCVCETALAKAEGRVP